MVTWQIDRLLRSGPLCAILTFLLPAALAVVTNAVSDTENVLGVMMLASAIICLGSMFGSVVAAGLGALLFGLGAVAAEPPVAVLAIIGIGLFATLIVHDLAGTFRRAPTINISVWKNAGVVTAAVAVASGVAVAVSYGISQLATWQTIVLPFGLAAVGFAAKLASDSHASNARQLTAKRTPSPTNHSVNRTTD